MDSKKMDKARKKYISKKSALAFIIWGAIIALIAFQGMSGDLRTGIIILIIGVLMIFLGSIRLFRRKYAQICINMIEGGAKSIDEISAASKLSYDKTVSLINKMITDGVFGGIYIDTSKREIIRKGLNSSISNNYTSSMSNSTSKNCPSCGAPCSDESVQSGKCEYCGAVL